MGTRDHIRKIDSELAALKSECAKAKQVAPETPHGNQQPPVTFFSRLSRLIPWISLVASILTFWFSYNQSKIANEQSQRPYVLPGKITISCDACEHPILVPKTFPVEANAALLLSFGNFGNTPAYDFAVNVTHWSEYRAIGPEFDFAEDPEGNFQLAELPPKENVPVEVPERAESIMAMRRKVPTQRGPNGEAPDEIDYIYGHFAYNDIFKNKHVVLYCRQYIPPNAVVPENWKACGFHEGEVSSFTQKLRTHSKGFARPKFYPPEPPDPRPPALRQPH